MPRAGATLHRFAERQRTIDEIFCDKVHLLLLGHMHSNWLLAATLVEMSRVTPKLRTRLSDASCAGRGRRETCKHGPMQTPVNMTGRLSAVAASGK